jgi:hypothetical protein
VPQLRRMLLLVLLRLPSSLKQDRQLLK